MSESREVTVELDGKQYGATYSVDKGMLHIKTHTESRSIAVGDEDSEAVAKRTLIEIVRASAHR